MDRTFCIKYLETSCRLIGQREYNIDFSKLDNSSLRELTELFRSILREQNIDDTKVSHISNRCMFLCIERRSVQSEGNLNTSMLCNFVAKSESPCPYKNDNDAKHYCINYRTER